MPITTRRGARPHPARLASAAATALLVGLLSGTGSSAADTAPVATRTDLDYSCGLPDHNGVPSADLEARVRVATHLPGSGVAGKPIEAGDVGVEVSLPRAGAAGLFPSATTVESASTLAIEAVQGEERAQATWQSTAPGTAIPRTGDSLLLAHTGEVPTVTVNSSGTLRLLAGALTLTLTPDVGAPVSLSCAPAPGDPREVARVSVPESAEPSAPAGEPSAKPPAKKEGETGNVTVSPRSAEEPPPVQDEDCAHMPTGELDTSVGEPPPPYRHTVTDLEGIPMCAYAVGLSTVRKQNGSMIINDLAGKPALMHVRGVVRSEGGGWSSDPLDLDGYSQIWSLAELDLPDARSTFLSFGFVPVSAAVSFETSKITILTSQPHTIDPTTAVNYVAFRQSLRLHDVEVNGTPLDVGPSCRTEKSFRVVLNGNMFSKEYPYVNVFSGGLLTGKVDIPAFTGCGTGGENLNGLFTAAISGPGNEIRMNQAPTCLPGDFPVACPPALPELPSLKPSSSS
ncbi:DUF6801 domain-containing protein [Streptomyces sp. NPDC047046]|uniref:DUF6801 domain-containing protein n=1 Tax=Streptomyces sp. NPDC047046 TaxID=3155378 RepID=UPI00340EB83C